MKRLSNLFLFQLVLFCCLLAGCGDSSSITKTMSDTPSTGANTVTALTAASVGSAYSTTISVGGSPPPFIVTVSSGSLPPGLTATSNSFGAVISGSPTTSGLFTFALTITDSANPTASLTTSFSINVAAGSGGP